MSSGASDLHVDGERRRDYRPVGTSRGTSLFATLKRTVSEFSEDNLSDWAASLTYYGLNCWFEQSVTDSFGPGKLAPLPDGLALLPGSCCPHYDGEDQRRPAFHRFIGSDELSGG